MDDSKKDISKPETVNKGTSEKDVTEPNSLVEKRKEEVDNAAVEEAMKDMPPEVRKSFRMAMMQSSSIGRVTHPLFEKFNEKHIDKFLDYSQRDDDNIYKLKSSNRWFYLLYTLIALGFIIFLITFLLPLDKEMFTEILKLTVTFAGGVGSGYGIKSVIDKRN
ncbi:MAG: hypothetical protein K9I71_12330 [Ignavibacteriales bacterium]|nr:hypothetical protein [Ignavibacteriales bacterium]MCF8438527.1 hypothetical protein [Ignavibacteriales bacterium]